MKRFFTLVLILQSSQVLFASDPLPRRGALGLSFSPAPAEAAEKHGLKSGEGLVAGAAVPGLTAEKLGIKSGDLILSINGQSVSAQKIGAFVRELPSGKEVKFQVIRDGKPLEIKGILMEKPRDPGNQNFKVTYSHVVSNGERFRTIITEPTKPGKHPAMFFIQGLAPASYDYVLEGPASLQRLNAPLLFDFANSNFVTIRVEKPGVGDSEGKPYPEWDYLSEQDIYRQTLKQLQGLGTVDRDNILIFGHSMGGAFGPMVSAENPVKAIAVFGTAARTWFEYIIDILRYQATLGGASFESVDDQVRVGGRIMSEIILKGRSVEDVKKSYPDQSAMVDSFFPGGLFNGKSAKFWSQLADINFAKQWADCKAHVLAVHGVSDFVSYSVDHKLIADIVNRANPGKGTHWEAPNSDHLFNAWPTEAESLKNWPNGTFNMDFSNRMKEWFLGLKSK